MDSNLALIGALVEQAPDKVLHDLETALGGDMGGSALSGVRALVDAEVAERGLRDIVLAPFKPMFGARPDGIGQLAFARPAYAGLWRALRAETSGAVEAAAAVALRGPEEGVFPDAYDAVCRLAADGLRHRSEGFAAVAARLEAATPGAAAELAGCLDLSAVVRPALSRLADWLQKMSEERAATVRLAFKDAVAITPDGGPRLFEILFANLQEPWAVLRLISAVMVRPVDNYVSASELAVFGERLISDIGQRLAAIRDFDLDAGVAAGDAIGAHIRIIGAEVDEFERSLNLGREGPWGAQLNRHKAALAKTMEGHLRKADDVVAAALPLAGVKIGGRVMRQAPRLDGPPDERLVRRATAMLTLLEQVRSAAVSGGYNALRGKVVEEVEQRLNAYAEDLLDTIHNGEGDEIGHARLYLEQVADMTGRIRDKQAAQIVRRRAAAA